MPKISEARERVSKVVFGGQFGMEKVPESEIIPNTVFTGTTLGYLRSRLKEQGTLANKHNKVYISPLIFAATKVAFSRAVAFKDTPILLVIGTNVTNLNVREDDLPRKELITDPISKTSIIAAYDISPIERINIIERSNQERFKFVIENCRQIEL